MEIKMAKSYKNYWIILEAADELEPCLFISRHELCIKAMDSYSALKKAVKLGKMFYPYHNLEANLKYKEDFNNV
jgi:hypothetical protein